MLCLVFVFLGIGSLQANSLSLKANNGKSITIKAIKTGVEIHTSNDTLTTKNQSIRLLPGTYISKNSDAKISLANKTLQQELAFIQQKQREAQMLEMAMHLCSCFANEYHSKAKIYPDYPHLPFEKAHYNGYHHAFSAIIVNTTILPGLPVSRLIKMHINPYAPKQKDEELQMAYLPDLSWGKSANTINVLRC